MLLRLQVERLTMLLVTGILLTSAGCMPSNAGRTTFPEVAFDVRAPEGESSRTAVFAGGCFWGMEAVFEHIKGVEDVVSGFAEGAKPAAEPPGGATPPHAEAVRIVYDPKQISYGQLLKTFFAVAHDPTQLNRQGPDVGPQYRSAVFVADADEQRAATSYIQRIDEAKIFRKRVVTEVVRLQMFRVADSAHQDYAARHPNSRYIVANDLPKIVRLKRELPEFYRDRPSLPDLAASSPQ
jgi:peptide-methionine (S)-S-oxide reductase